MIVLFLGCSAPFFSANTVDEVCDYAREACDIWDTIWVNGFYDTTEVSVYYPDCMPSGAPYTVYFAENSAEIPDSTEMPLYEALSVMELCETSDMMITGHCDDRLSEQYNDSLGFERAKSVMKWFRDRGINGFRIMIYSRGESDQIAKVSYDARPKYWRLKFGGADTPDTSDDASWVVFGQEDRFITNEGDTAKAKLLLDKYDYSGNQMRQEIWRLNRRAEIKILK